MARAAKGLPEDYQPAGTLDFAKSRLTLLALNVAGIVLLVLVVALLQAFLAATRPDVGLHFVLRGREMLLALAVAAALVVLVVVVHEFIHGAGFWLVTRERPEYRFRGYYVSAGAPEWYIPVGQYLWIGLAPLVVVTLGGLGLLRVVPPEAIPAVLWVVAFNAAGTVGDIATVAWLCVQPRDSLVRDAGDAIALYRRTSTQAH